MFAGLLAKWGLGWVLGPAGKIMAVVTVLIVAVTIIRADAKADCRADQLEATIEQMQADQKAADEITETAQARATEAENRADELERLTNELISENADRGDGCAVSDELREQLRAIR